MLLRTVHFYDLIEAGEDGSQLSYAHNLFPLQWTRKHGLQYAQHTNMGVLCRKQL